MVRKVFIVMLSAFAFSKEITRPRGLESLIATVLNILSGILLLGTLVIFNAVAVVPQQ
jgi:hypothetical protein